MPPAAAMVETARRGSIHRAEVEGERSLVMAMVSYPPPGKVVRAISTFIIVCVLREPLMARYQ
jgi:hypothetical protein